MLVQGSSIRPSVLFDVCLWHKVGQNEGRNTLFWSIVSIPVYCAACARHILPPSTPLAVVLGEGQGYDKDEDVLGRRAGGVPYVGLEPLRPTRTTHIHGIAAYSPMVRESRTKGERCIGI